MRGLGGIRLIIAAVIALISFGAYYLNTSKNPFTGETQRLAGISVQDEIQLGLHARDQMASQFGGFETNPQLNRVVDAVGQRLVKNTRVRQTEWKFEFHVLNDSSTVNAFALPGGQIFITEALLRQLQTEGQLAGVLGHEIGHVVGRHGAEHMAKARLTQGLTGAAVIASGDYRTAQMAQVIGGLINMRYGRADELESDKLGVEIMAEAGYDPTSMVGVMQVLKKAGGGRKQPEFFSTHPNPENRIERIKQEVRRLYPQGVPRGLKK